MTQSAVGGSEMFAELILDLEEAIKLAEEERWDELAVTSPKLIDLMTLTEKYAHTRAGDGPPTRDQFGLVLKNIERLQSLVAPRRDSIGKLLAGMVTTTKLRTLYGP